MWSMCDAPAEPGQGPRSKGVGRDPAVDLSCLSGVSGAFALLDVGFVDLDGQSFLFARRGFLHCAPVLNFVTERREKDEHQHDDCEDGKTPNEDKVRAGKPALAMRTPENVGPLRVALFAPRHVGTQLSSCAACAQDETAAARHRTREYPKGRCQKCEGVRFRKRPRPTLPQNFPSRTATSPRTVTMDGRPSISHPSKAL